MGLKVKYDAILASFDTEWIDKGLVIFVTKGDASLIDKEPVEEGAPSGDDSTAAAISLEVCKLRLESGKLEQ